MPDFQELLTAALAERLKQVPQSFNDLNAVAAELNCAVAGASGGRMRVILVPVRTRIHGRIGMALVVRFTQPEEERVIRVLETAVENSTGYPMKMWRSLEKWEFQSDSDFDVISRAEELHDNLQGLVTSPQSELVRLIANELAVAEAGTEAALAG